MKLPPNTRVWNGYIEFRKRHKGEPVNRAWPLRDKAKAFREIYDLLAKIENNKDVSEVDRRVLVEEACRMFYDTHSPSLKVREIAAPSEQPAYNLQCRLNVIKAAWSGRFWDTITKYDVRDLLKQFDTVGTQLKYLGTLTKMFKSFHEWNEEGLLDPKVRTPHFNPATKWRAQMRPSQKRELPRIRVLTTREWGAFKIHLSARARQICEIALRRFLRLSDIKAISHMSIRGDIIEGVQQKTGEPFSIPVLDDQPTNYDFTNFEREFHNAQVAAAMDYPKTHALHFTMRDLRRTGATWAYRETKDLEAIRRMLGHTKISTAVRYLGLDDADLSVVAQAVDKLANLGGNLGGFAENDAKSESRSDLKYNHFRPVSSVG